MAEYRTSPPTAADPRPWIGVLMVGPPVPGAGLNSAAFTEQLRSLGHRDGENCTVWVVWVDSWDARLGDQARQLASSKPDVIVASGSALALAARQATSTIPIVMTCDDGDAVGAGLIASFARPSGNVTGLGSNFSGVCGQRLRFLKAAVPRLTTVGVLWNEAVPDKASDWANVRPVAEALQVRLQSFPATDPEALEAAFGRAAAAALDGLLTFADAMMLRFRRKVIAFAAEQHLPAIYESRAFAASGGLMAYGPPMPALYARTAVYIDKLLQGARPGELPVERPTRFDLTLNARTAEVLGLSLPASLLAEAVEILR